MLLPGGADTCEFTLPVVIHRPLGKNKLLPHVACPCDEHLTHEILLNLQSINFPMLRIKLIAA